MEISRPYVEIRPRFAPIWKSGIRRTTGGITISDTTTPSTVLFAGKCQFAKPQAAKDAIAMVRTAAPNVTITEFMNQVENCAESTLWKPASVGLSGRLKGDSRNCACVLNAAVNIRYIGRSAPMATMPRTT